MTDVDVLADRIHEISTSKGFKAPSLKNLPEKLMLSVSELAEALEEDRSNKPLLYWKCPQCETESHQPLMEHRLPRKGILNWLMRVFPAIGASICPNSYGKEPWKPEGILVEIGDSVIRNLHMMHSLITTFNENLSGDHLTVSEILNLKVGFNADRPAMHGRNY
jgi:hypothetical protein